MRLGGPPIDPSHSTRQPAALQQQCSAAGHVDKYETPKKTPNLEHGAGAWGGIRRPARSRHYLALVNMHGFFPLLVLLRSIVYWWSSASASLRFFQESDPIYLSLSFARIPVPSQLPHSHNHNCNRPHCNPIALQSPSNHPTHCRLESEP